MTKREADRLLAKWKRRMRLDGWVIVPTWVSKECEPGERCGLCEFETGVSHVAKITVNLVVDDPERTLVHELLHVLLQDTVGRVFLNAGDLIGGDRILTFVARQWSEAEWRLMDTLTDLAWTPDSS